MGAGWSQKRLAISATYIYIKLLYCSKATQEVQGMSLKKCLLCGLRFFCIFEKSGKNKATDLAVSEHPTADLGCPRSHLISTQPHGVST